MKQFSLEEAVRAGLVDQQTLTDNEESIESTQSLDEYKENENTQRRKKMPKPKQSEYSVVRFVFRFFI